MAVNMIEKISCRVCLNTKCDETVSFLDNESFLTLYQFCTDVVVDLNIYPLRVCNECVEKIENYAKFKQQCKESEDFWKNTLNKSCLQSKDGFKTEDGLYKDCAENDFGDNTIYDVCCDYYFGSEIKSIREINSAKSKNLLKSKQRAKKCANCKRVFKYSKCLINHKCLSKKSISREGNNKGNQINDNQDLEKREVQTLNNDFEKEEVVNSCGLCDISLNNKAELINHLTEHSSNNLLKCKICGYDGPDFAKMISHRFTHVRQHVWCHICDRRSRSAKVLEYHYRSAHLHKPGQCAFCATVCKNYHSWRKHDRLHTDNRLFICDLCDKRFLYKNQIVAHLIDHSDVRDFICETCGRGFKRLSSLKIHIESVHDTKNPVICDHCNRRFKSKDRLNLHLKNLAVYKPYQCSVCSKRYRLECYLKYHMFWHTGERPHICEICGSKYKGKAHLKVHMRKHTGERPHKCSVCSKEFTTPHQAKRHMSVHTGVPQHKCRSCKKRFHSLKALLEHSMQHGNEGADLKA